MTDAKLLPGGKAGQVPKPSSETIPGFFARGVSYYKLFWVFFIASFLGAITETLFMLLTLDLLSGSLRDAGVNAFFQSSAWFAAMFLAGLLPPLLFFLGSLLPKKRLTTAKNVIK